MKSFGIGIVLGCLALSSVPFAQASLSPEAQLKAAMNREMVDRDVAGALELYKQIAEKFSDNHPVASKALLQMGGIYERMGKPARPTYEEIVNKYPDTGATAAAARARLTAIQEAAAGPFKWKSLDVWVKDATYVEPSPDGKYLTYARAKSTPAASGQDAMVTYLRDLESGRERVLIDAKPDEGPSGPITWSPDSQRGALMMHLSGGSELRIVTIGTREVRTIWKGTFSAPAFRWTSDSRQLAFTVKPSREVDSYEHRLVSAGDSAESVLVDTLKDAAPAVTWSPDGRRLAYVVRGADADTIRIKTAGAESVSSIRVPKPGPNSRVTIGAWLPDGDIEFVQTVSGGNDSYLVSASGGTPRPICEGRGSSGGDGCQGLSPDGTLQITRKNLTGGGRIVLRNVKDGSERSLTPEATIEQTALGFSPDGRLFGFRSNRDGSFAFYVVPTDSIPVAAPIKIFSLESDAAGVSGSWTPGGMIVRLTNNQTNQYRVDVDPRTGKPVGAPVRLTEESLVNVGARISPDGRRIAYVSRSRPIGIALMDANGAHEHVIKEVPPDMLGRMVLLGWVSDSELLLSDAKLGTGSLRDAPPLHLMRMNVASGEMREAGPVVEGLAPYLAADGNVFYVVKDDFFVRPIAGGPVRGITIKDWWDFSVSTQWLAYSTADESVAKGKPLPGDIRVRSLDTGIERVAVKFADTDDGSQAPLDVSRDGRFLLYREPLGKVMMANVDTGESWPVLRNPPAGIDFEWASARLSPDGTYLVLDGRISKTTWRAYDGVTYDAVTKLIGAKK